ncbi:hypothetical protein EV361DRAFT_954940 [Lentinula raphanica]|nr:hypothetical protein EV361DRAFT_954940 [Lentinula raphanica]
MPGQFLSSLLFTPSAQSRPLGQRLTRSGRECVGLSKAATAEALDAYNAVVLSNFDLSSLLQPVHFINVEEDDNEDEPLLRQYLLCPRSSPTRSYTLTTLAELAANRFKPAPPTLLPPPHPIHHLISPLPHRLKSKRLRERAKRAEDRYQRQVQLGIAIKAYQLAHVVHTQSRALPVHFDIAQSIAESPTWTGSLDTGIGRCYSLDELLALPGFQLVPNNGSTTLLFKDCNGRPLFLLGQRSSKQDRSRLLNSFETAMAECNLSTSSTEHRRGRYSSKSFGILFGGGQVHPGNLCQSKADDRAWNNFRSTPEVQKLAQRVDYLFKCYFPRLHTLYTNVLSDLLKADPNLDANFEGCCFAASTLNFQHAITVPHRDSKNLICGECAVVARFFRAGVQ